MDVPPIVHIESNYKPESAKFDAKYDREESEYAYDNVDCNHCFSEEHDIVEYVTNETSH